jgi:hypothetical protein
MLAVAGRPSISNLQITSSLLVNTNLSLFTVQGTYSGGEEGLPLRCPVVSLLLIGRDRRKLDRVVDGERRTSPACLCDSLLLFSYFSLPV